MANSLASALNPGAIAIAGDCLHAGCAEASALEILELQPEGKRRMSAREFINGYHPRAGEKFGEPPRLAEAPPVTA
jgi:methionyl-tRNA formyltransferase